MGADLVVALGPATVHGDTLFGQNCHGAADERRRLCLAPGREFALGETVRRPHVELPQARLTSTVLAGQAEGAWGYEYGVNEHQVAAGCTGWSSRLACTGAGLHGPDLVRLVLERSAAARPALDLLTDLLSRHGQADGEHIFLIADPAEAFVVEAAGDGWAAQEIRQVRAVSDVTVIRQDWDHIAPGLADRAAALGWWTADGSKLDFAGTLSEDPMGPASALRRWGRATFLLEQQNGHIDAPFVRRLLADHYEGTPFEVDPVRPGGAVTPLCQHGPTEAARPATTASFVTALSASPERLPTAWCAFGPPCIGIHLPVFLDGDLPAAFGTADGLWQRTRTLLRSLGGDEARWDMARETLGWLQARLEQEAEEFAAEAAGMRRRGARDELRRLAGALMQSHIERLGDVVQALASAHPTHEREPAPARRILH
jgi:dipeptidase